MATEPAVLTHLEKTLSDSYRKEIDQEENVWRTLPFFSATLALQLSVLTSAMAKVAAAMPVPAWQATAGNGCIVVSIACTLLALGFVAASVFPAQFRYLPQDDQILAYGNSLILWEAGLAPPITKDALHHLKETLANQYALSSSNNRMINQARQRQRAIAGLFTLLALCSTVVLVAVRGLA